MNSPHTSLRERETPEKKLKPTAGGSDLKEKPHDTSLEK